MTFSLDDYIKSINTDCKLMSILDLSGQSDRSVCWQMWCCVYRNTETGEGKAEERAVEGVSLWQLLKGKPATHL